MFVPLIFASLLDLKGYNRVERAFVSLTFRQFARPQRLHPGGESVCTSYFRQFIRPQRLQPSGESVCISYIPTVCETSEITTEWRKCLYLSYFASLLGLKGYNRVERAFVSLTFRQFVRPQRLQPSGESVCTSHISPVY